MLQRVALEHGLILVDTKYEFGKGHDGSVLLIDEVCSSFEYFHFSLSLADSPLHMSTSTQIKTYLIGLWFLF